MPVTQEMLDAIPAEWLAEIEKQPDRPKLYDDEFIRKLDAVLIRYYPQKSMRALAQSCGCKENIVYKRVQELRAKGMI